MKHCSQCGKELQKSVDIFFRDSKVYCKDCGRKYDIENETGYYSLHSDKSKSTSPSLDNSVSNSEQNIMSTKEIQTKIDTSSTDSTRKTLNVLGLIIYIIGILAGLIMGFIVGNNADFGLGFVTFLGIPFSSFVLGSLLIGIGDIIKLLQENNRLLSEIRNNTKNNQQ